MRRVVGILTVGAVLVAGLVAGVGTAGVAAAGPDPDPTRSLGDDTVATARGNHTPMPCCAPVVHRVWVAYVTNRGDFDAASTEFAGVVDAALARWRAMAPNAFVSLTRVNEPVAYAASVMPAAEEGCGLREGDGLRLSAAYAEARHAVGITNAKTPGVADHLVLVAPPACALHANGFQGRAKLNSSFLSSGDSMIAPTPGSAQAMADVLVHELGHNFGLGHAQIGCPLGSTGACPPTFDSDCWSPMGSNAGSDVSTAHRAMSGILQPGEMMAINGDGGAVHTDVTLRPRGETTGARGLAVTDSETGATYYLDYRTVAGLDQGVGCQEGITITTLDLDVPTGNRGTALRSPPSGATWQVGSVATLGRGLTVQVLSADPGAGAVLRVSADPPPAFRKTGSARLVLSGEAVLGTRAVLEVGGLRPTPTKVEYRWYLDGVLLMEPESTTPVDDVELRIRWEGGSLVGEATAYRDGRRRATVRSRPVKIIRPSHLGTPEIVGDMVVGQKAQVLFILRPRAFRHREVRYVWSTGGKVVADRRRDTLLLTSDLVGKKLRVAVRVIGPGKKHFQRISKLSPPVSL